MSDNIKKWPNFAFTGHVMIHKRNSCGRQYKNTDCSVPFCSHKSCQMHNQWIIIQFYDDANLAIQQINWILSLRITENYNSKSYAQYREPLFSPFKKYLLAKTFFLTFIQHTKMSGDLHLYNFCLKIILTCKILSLLRILILPNFT